MQRMRTQACTGTQSERAPLATKWDRLRSRLPAPLSSNTWQKMETLEPVGPLSVQIPQSLMISKSVRGPLKDYKILITLLKVTSASVEKVAVRYSRRKIAPLRVLFKRTFREPLWVKMLQGRWFSFRKPVWIRRLTVMHHRKKTCSYLGPRLKLFSWDTTTIKQQIW